MNMLNSSFAALLRVCLCSESLMLSSFFSGRHYTFFLYITTNCLSSALLEASLCIFPGSPAHSLARTGNDLCINVAVFKCIVFSIQFPFGKKHMSLLLG